jgi:hypothetical protein
MRVFAALLSLALCACATVRETYAPDGRKAYALNCSGSARGWDKCVAKAGQLCGSAGYDVLSANGETGWVAGMGGGNAYGGSTHERSMLVACKR